MKLTNENIEKARKIQERKNRVDVARHFKPQLKGFKIVPMHDGRPPDLIVESEIAKSHPLFASVKTAYFKAIDAECDCVEKDAAELEAE